jgi:hypothetical protein
MFIVNIKLPPLNINYCLVYPGGYCIMTQLGQFGVEQQYPGSGGFMEPKVGWTNNHLKLKKIMKEPKEGQYKLIHKMYFEWHGLGSYSLSHSIK